MTASRSFPARCETTVIKSIKLDHFFRALFLLSSLSLSLSLSPFFFLSLSVNFQNQPAILRFPRALFLSEKRRRGGKAGKGKFGDSRCANIDSDVCDSARYPEHVLRVSEADMQMVNGGPDSLHCRRNESTSADVDIAAFCLPPVAIHVTSIHAELIGARSFHLVRIAIRRRKRPDTRLRHPRVPSIGAILRRYLGKTCLPFSSFPVIEIKISRLMS